MYGEGIPLCSAWACEEGSVFKHAEPFFLLCYLSSKNRPSLEWQGFLGAKEAFLLTPGEQEYLVCHGRFGKK